MGDMYSFTREKLKRRTSGTAMGDTYNFTNTCKQVTIDCRSGYPNTRLTKVLKMYSTDYFTQWTDSPLTNQLFSVGYIRVSMKMNPPPLANSHTVTTVAFPRSQRKRHIDWKNKMAYKHLHLLLTTGTQQKHFVAMLLTKGTQQKHFVAML